MLQLSLCQVLAFISFLDDTTCFKNFPVTIACPLPLLLGIQWTCGNKVYIGFYSSTENLAINFQFHKKSYCPSLLNLIFLIKVHMEILNHILTPNYEVHFNIVITRSCVLNSAFY